jgi:hypothetical protein
MVTEWNASVSHRLGDSNAGGGIPFINAAYFTMFENEMATEAVRANSMAAMRAGQPFPNGVKYGYGVHPTAPLPMQQPNFTPHHPLAPPPVAIQPVPTSTAASGGDKNPGGKGTMKTCASCRKHAKLQVPYSKVHAEECQYRKMDQQVKLVAAAAAAAAAAAVASAASGAVAANI